jgi:hypothetical protein
MRIQIYDSWSSFIEFYEENQFKLFIDRDRGFFTGKIPSYNKYNYKSIDLFISELERFFFRNIVGLVKYNEHFLKSRIDEATICLKLSKFEFYELECIFIKLDATRLMKSKIDNKTFLNDCLSRLDIELTEDLYEQALQNVSYNKSLQVEIYDKVKLNLINKTGKGGLKKIYSFKVTPKNKSLLSDIREGLINSNLIDDQTSREDFKNVFNGSDIDNITFINWTGSKASLKYFIKKFQFNLSDRELKARTLDLFRHNKEKITSQQYNQNKGVGEKDKKLIDTLFIHYTISEKQKN